MAVKRIIKKFGGQKKGVLLTLLMLIIFILMMSELVSYVLTNISYNEIATRSSIAINTGSFSAYISSSLAGDMQYALYEALQLLYSQGTQLPNSPYGSNATQKILYSMVYNGTENGITYNAIVNSSIVQYTKSIYAHASKLGFNLKILNPSLRVYQNSTWYESVSYTALALINSSAGTFTYPIYATATVPLSGAKAEYVLPITFTNYQGIPTPSPFQQMLQINSSLYSKYEARNLTNIEFIYQNGTVIPSWLESGATNNSTNTIYWLKLNGIQAKGYVQVYMVFSNPSINMFNGVTVGEASQLSPSYGEYDDGSHVFNFYSSFRGNSLNTSKWNLASGTPVINNGLVMELDSGASISSKLSFSNPAIFESDMVFSSAGSGSGNVLGGMYISNPTEGGTYFIGWHAAEDYFAAGEWNPSQSWIKLANYPSLNKQYVWGITWLPTSGYPANMYINYTGKTVPASYNSNSAVTIYMLAQNNDNAAFISYWVRERAYPPNGIMPNVSIGTPSLYIK
ncbi:MAG: DUF2341 domain-containing protein [Candidatus Micrarchaeaceae archaeon]